MTNLQRVPVKRRATLWAAAVAGSAILLAGCTSNSGSDTTTNTVGSASKAPASSSAVPASSSAATAESATSAAPQSIPPVALPGKNGVVGASVDLVGGICEYSAGAWNLTGTLKNSQKGPQNYTVRVSVSNKKTSSVVDAVVISEKVEAGKSIKLDKAGIIQTPASAGLDCLINVTRKAA